MVALRKVLNSCQKGYRHKYQIYRTNLTTWSKSELYGLKHELYNIEHMIFSANGYMEKGDFRLLDIRRTEFRRPDIQRDLSEVKSFTQGNMSFEKRLRKLKFVELSK